MFFTIFFSITMILLIVAGILSIADLLGLLGRRIEITFKKKDRK